jgi:hypothetical protein
MDYLPEVRVETVSVSGFLANRCMVPTIPRERDLCQNFIGGEMSIVP